MKLIIEDDEGHKTTVPFVREEITVGRDEINTIRLTERNVSRKHARFFRSNGSIYVEDCKSSNGIRVNGDRISEAVALKEGDLVQIGDYDLAVTGEEAARPAPAPAPPPEQTVQQRPMPAQSGALTQPISAFSDEAEPAPGRPAPSPARAPVAQAEGQEISAHESPRLVIVSTEFAGREFACLRSVVTVGGDESCDIHIDHRSLSGLHCKLSRDNSGTWHVQDQGSKNKVLINNEEYAESPLKSGDVLTLGHVQLRFVAPGEDFVFNPDGDKPAKSKLPFIIGGLVLAALASAGLWFGVLNKGKGPVVPENPRDTPRTSGSADPTPSTSGSTADLDPKGTKPEPKAIEVKPVTPDAEVKIDEPKVDGKGKELVQKARAAMAAGNLAEAKKLYGEAAAAHAGDLSSDLTKLSNEEDAERKWTDAQKKAASKDYAGALALADEIADNTEAKARFNGVRSTWEQGRDKAAGGHPNVKSTKPDPKPDPTPIQVTTAPDNTKRAFSLREEGLKFYKSNDFENAQVKLKESLSLNDRDAESHKLYAAALAATGDIDQALVHYKQYLSIAPTTDRNYNSVRDTVAKFEASRKAPNP
jgi:pSer/pThr/pTyr-binding forkhead associated (FHA) protein